MIIIDTDMMRDLVNASRAANDSITDAAEVLNSITVHNNWACKERDALNDYTLRNKKQANELQENAYAFLGVLQEVAGQYETTETGISNLFVSVESILSDILNILPGTAIPILPPPIPGITGGSGFVGNLLNGLWNNVIGTPPPGLSNPFDNFQLENILEPLSITSFNDLAQSLGGIAQGAVNVVGGVADAITDFFQ